MKKRRGARAPGARAKAGKPARVRSRPGARGQKRIPLSLSAPVQESKLHTMTIADFYRPLKKPVTLRLDADVLAWFKKDGRRYQTRINSALRRVMEREIKQAGM